MRKVYLEFHDDAANSHKFYRVTYQADGMALIEWGRIGSAPQSQLKTQGEAENKLLEKQSKGYVTVGNSGGREVFPVKRDGKPRPKKADLSIWDELAAQGTRRAK